MTEIRAIKIAVTALGGQGGGVLTDWIVKLGEQNGYIAQSTSVPGVAQRTGATIYYVELFPQCTAKAAGKSPVLALMPVPGDVDIVIAAELMEAGRAITRGFVTEKTTLIASSHRDYAISEKIIMGDGRHSGAGIIQAAKKSAGRFIYADMLDSAVAAGAVISSVLFGALAKSNALPIARDKFEETIRATGRSVESNLQGFAAGWEAAALTSDSGGKPFGENDTKTRPSPAVAPLLQRLVLNFPPTVHFVLNEGLKRTIDFQDVKYAHLYLDRMERTLAVDRASGGERKEWRLTETVGKHLALWMTYEDSIRVADIKTRAGRFARLRDDVHADRDQIVNVSEYLHPRVEEVCDVLPSGIASIILKSPAIRNMLKLVLGGGKRIPTTKLRGFLLLRFLAAFRPVRRSSYRFKLEEQRINDWFAIIIREAPLNYSFACEIAGLQRLVKGYGETHERGLGNFNRIMALVGELKAQAEPAQAVARLRDAALTDEEGVAFAAAINELRRETIAAA